MKKYLYFLVLLFVQFLINAQDDKNFPEDYIPHAWVNDYADLFPESEESYLNRKLGMYEDSTSTQILIVTLNQDLHKNMPVELMGATIGESWHIGQGKSDNGMIIVIYPKERKISIQTGYGLESLIPDAIAKRIIENEITPNFRNGDYLTGLDQATDVIFSLLSGEFTAGEYRSQSWGSPAAPFGFLIILVLFFIFFGQSRRRRAHDIGHNLPFWIALGMLSGSRNTHRGSFNNFRSGSGSFGGFGGFSGGGGGSFGGGGASGSW